MSKVKPPQKRPCGSCPYRKDVPSGVWDASEYMKLPGFDLPTFDQPQGVFLCHQQDGHLCAGWCGTHDMTQNLGLRLAAIKGSLTPEEVEEVMDYVSPVPLFESGSEAAMHGLADIEQPDERAQTVVKNLLRKGLGKQ